ncbi:hypothetical protein [Marinobacter subterrani]|uniref:Uncharacterized protein n=1 Tax=Marinobacter subterrani TaxID=1658765 RepID=A0A0J7JBM9_9GAMM|nr:hypothetical protein [Marinobacter subterrani]KMQ75537.1 hypothetical protein Msub_11745 [Marinobacter subterrani]
MFGNRQPAAVAFDLFRTSCDSEQTEPHQNPMIATDEAMEQPKQDVTSRAARMRRNQNSEEKDLHMNRIVYIVGAVVIILVILSFFGFR